MKILLKNWGANFIHKYSKTLLLELKNYIKENYGFGDFVFRHPETKVELDRVDNLDSLQKIIATVDGASLFWVNYRQIIRNKQPIKTLQMISS